MTLSLLAEEKKAAICTAAGPALPNYKKLQTKTEQTKAQSQNHLPFSLKSNIFNVYD